MRFSPSLLKQKRIRFWLFLSVLFLTVLGCVGLSSYFDQASYAQGNGNQNHLPEERILRYQSEIVVNEDASLEVTEIITVNATGDEIQRGIYRDFPLDAPFSLLEVLRNGDATDYFLEGIGDQKRINIYDPDVELEPGNYTYTIQYEIDRQLDFSEGDIDRLYWNVTGQDWSFPIDQVRAKVFLPDEIPEEEIHLNAFTGREGERGQSYEAQLDAGGNPTFATTRSLEAEEGLSIAVEFPTGYVDRPGFLEGLYYALLIALKELAFILLVVLIVVGFFILSFYTYFLFRSQF